MPLLTLDAMQKDHLPTQTLVAMLVLAATCFFHALFLPAFEGPDEPFHLGRVGFEAEGRLSPDILAAVRARPCCEDLHRATGCPRFGSEPAAWNLVSGIGGSPSTGRVESVENYQVHQPPLAYLAMDLALRPIGSDDPADRLLALRLAAVLLVLGGTWLMRSVLPLGVWFLWVGGLLLPGAAESLVRVSNDVWVFSWATLCLWLLHRDRPWVTLAVTALGPFLKLTAFPVVAFVVVSLWSRGSRKPAVLAGVLSLAIVPYQWLRGWAWGGTLEMNTGFEVGHGASEIVPGVLHSVYTFFKTAFWLGGWSVFRPPFWLLALALVVVAGYVSRLRIRRRTLWIHLPALFSAMAGFVAFAVGKSHLFGVWGAVGGWYFWPWSPWLAMVFHDLKLDPRRGRTPVALPRVVLPMVVLPMVVLVVASRWAWIVEAVEVYGWP